MTDLLSNRLGNFLRAIFDGLLRQLPKSSLGNFRRASFGKFSSRDHRWTPTPTSAIFSEQFSTCIVWESFFARSSSTKFSGFEVSSNRDHQPYIGPLLDGLQCQSSLQLFGSWVMPSSTKTDQARRSKTGEPSSYGVGCSLQSSRGKGSSCRSRFSNVAMYACLSFISVRTR